MVVIWVHERRPEIKIEVKFQRRNRVVTGEIACLETTSILNNW